MVMLEIILKEFTVAGTVPDFNRIPFLCKKTDAFLHHLSVGKVNFLKYQKKVFKEIICIYVIFYISIQVSYLIFYTFAEEKEESWHIHPISLSRQ